MTSSISLLRNLALAAAATLACAGNALAADTRASADAQARYRQEMAVCDSGRSNQDTATCREEARKALAAARSGQLNEPSTSYQQNATQRCGVLQGDDMRDCEARMRGQGSVEGSVGGGGIIRESVTTTITPGK